VLLARFRKYPTINLKRLRARASSVFFKNRFVYAASRVNQRHQSSIYNNNVFNSSNRQQNVAVCAYRVAPACKVAGGAAPNFSMSIRSVRG
jgi:hypothetical protein